MLIIFLLFYLLQAKALPTSPSFGPSVLPYEPHTLLFGRASGLSDERTLVDIVRSCLLTIFACIYRAIHPNIPDPEAHWAQVQFERAKITLHALVAPEIIIFWAIRQWRGARMIKTEINEVFKSKKINIRWTTTHGHFAQMGGFCREDTKFVLSPPDLIQLVKEDRINLKGLRLDRKDIQDRSKGDLISEGFIYLQTTWFLVECVARWITHLPVTELEVITFAYAAFNIATFLFWIRKPLNINRPNYLEVCDSRAVQTAIESEEKAVYHPPSTTCLVVSPVTPLNPTNTDYLPVSGDTTTPSWGNVFLGFEWGSDKPLMLMVFSRVQVLVNEGQTPWAAPREHYNSFTRPLMTCFIYLIRWPFCLITAPFFELVNQPIVEANTTHVPCYYGIKIPVEDWCVMWRPAIFIALAFGGIHMAAWSSHFPTLIEQKLWRICSIIIIALPAYILLTGESASFHDRCRNMGRRTRIVLQAFCIFVTVSSFFIMSATYAAARICLMVLAFRSLTTLSPNALTGIGWSSVFPHF